MEERFKKVSDSQTEQAYIVRARYLNSSGRLFGGSLMSWIDETGAMAARRHCNMSVTTVAVDNLQFVEPVMLSQIVVLVAKVTHVGSSSMEVRVDTYVENLEGMRSRVNRAYLVYVALKDNVPTRVPRLIVESESEKAEWEAGERRALLRRERRKEGY